jgi:hypothetical protein
MTKMTMTRRGEVLGDFKVDRKGMIESLYVPALWDAAKEGGADFYDGHTVVHVMVLDDEDRAEFPELEGTAVVWLWECAEHFIHHREFKSVADSDEAQAKIEGAHEREDEEEDEEG